MLAPDIPRVVEWMRIIQTWHKAMHTSVGRHTLHLIVDLIGTTLPTTNVKRVKPAHLMLFRKPHCDACNHNTHYDIGDNLHK